MKVYIKNIAEFRDMSEFYLTVDGIRSDYTSILFTNYQIPIIYIDNNDYYVFEDLNEFEKWNDIIKKIKNIVDKSFEIKYMIDRDEYNEWIELILKNSSDDLENGIDDIGNAIDKWHNEIFK